jgi:hypothetical protein
LRYYAVSWKVMGLIPNEVNKFFSNLILPAALQQMHVQKLLVLHAENLKVMKKIMINYWKTVAEIT